MGAGSFGVFWVRGDQRGDLKGRQRVLELP